jgi:hypothetical protein
MNHIKHRMMAFVLFIGVVFVIACALSLSQFSSFPATDLDLTLLPIDNISRRWPPAVLFERHDGTGIKISANSARYVSGVAVLVVENRGKNSCLLQSWNEGAWKIVVTFEDCSTLRYPLIGGRILPGFPPKILNLEAGEKLAMIVGIAETFPYNPRRMNNAPNLVGSMCVHYDSPDLSLQSNPLLVDFVKKKKGASRPFHHFDK